MEELQEIPQGNDIPFEIDLKNGNGTPLLPSSLNDYGVFIYSIKKNKTPLLIFKKTPTGSEKPIQVIDDAAGTIGCVIPRAFTKTATPDTLIVEVRTKSVAGSEYESNRYNSGQDQILLCKIVESAQPTLMQ